MSLLLRFWPHLLIAGAIIGAGLYLRHSGYESGFAASEAKWQARFSAAERERDAANARADRAEALSTQASEESQRRIDETQKTLLARAADYDDRLRSLSVRYAAARSRCQSVPSIPAGTASPDAAAESEQRASAFGGSLASIGADCEADASTVTEWQRYFTEQRAISEAARPPADR